VLRLQAEVADAIARKTSFEAAAGVRPDPSRLQAVVPDAYQAYLRGRFFWNKRTEPALRKAVEYFNEAIAKDGTYAPAYAGLADSWSLLASNSYDAVPPREGMPLAKAAAEMRQAQNLEPNFALAHQTLGMALAQKHDYPKAIAEFQTATSQPSTWPRSVWD